MADGLRSPNRIPPSQDLHITLDRQRDFKLESHDQSTFMIQIQNISHTWVCLLPTCRIVPFPLMHPQTGASVTHPARPLPVPISYSAAAASVAVVTTGRKIGNFELFSFSLSLLLPAFFLPSHIGIVPAKSGVYVASALPHRMTTVQQQFLS